MPERTKLTTLYEKTSDRGNRYFVGRLGATRVLLFRDEYAEGEDPVWNLLVQEIDGQQRTTPKGGRQQSRSGNSQSTSGNRQRRGRQDTNAPIEPRGKSGADLNDDLPI